MIQYVKRQALDVLQDGITPRDCGSLRRRLMLHLSRSEPLIDVSAAKAVGIESSVLRPLPPSVGSHTQFSGNGSTYLNTFMARACPLDLLTGQYK